MQCLEVSGAVRPLQLSLGIKGVNTIMRRIMMVIRSEKCIIWRSYKPVQHVTVLNTVGNRNIMVLYYNLMGPRLYMRSTVAQKVAMRCMIVVMATLKLCR